jgi:diacylglycerol kinase
MTNFANKKVNPFFDSFGCAIKGIQHVFRNERNFRLHITIAVVVLFFAYYLNFSSIEFAILIIVMSIVFVAEMVNSAIEYTWDKLEPNHHPVVGIIKDTMAGSVLIASLSAVVVGAIIIFRHLI